MMFRHALVAVIAALGSFAAVPALARNLTSRFPESRPLPNTGLVELEADGDGWRAVSWCGEAV